MSLTPIPYDQATRVWALDALMRLRDVVMSLKSQPKQQRELEGRLVRLTRETIEDIVSAVLVRFDTGTWSRVRAAQAANSFSERRSDLIAVGMQEAVAAAQYGQNRMIGQVQSLEGHGKGLTFYPISNQDRRRLRKTVDSAVDKLVVSLRLAALDSRLTPEEWQKSVNRATASFGRELHAAARSTQEYLTALVLEPDLRAMWLDCDDNRVRPTHELADGEVVTIGEKFSNGCRFPKDPLGSIEETRGCRCRLEIVV